MNILDQMHLILLQKNTRYSFDKLFAVTMYCDKNSLTTLILPGVYAIKHNYTPPLNKYLPCVKGLHATFNKKRLEGTFMKAR